MIKNEWFWKKIMKWNETRWNDLKWKWNVMKGS